MSGNHRPNQASAGPSNTGYTSTPGASKSRRLSLRTDPSDQAEAGPSKRRSTPRRIPSLASSADSGSTDAESDGSEGVDEREEGGEPLHSPSDWTYELVVLQHPQRARACGFGDKDRRPLSPPPIIRLYIRTASGQLVHPNRVAIQFLLLMVDLWSADGNQQRNTVMHPGSTPARQPSAPPIPSSAVLVQEDISRVPSPRPSTSDSRPPTGGSRPPTSHYPVSGWGWSDQHSPIAAKSTGPSPHTRIAGADRIQDSLPVPSSPVVPLLNSARPPPFNRSTSYIDDPTQSRQPPTTSIRPFTAPSPSRPPRPASSFGVTGANVTLPSLATLTESLSRPISARLTLNAIRDPKERLSTSTTSDSTGRPSTMSTLTNTGESARPSWSTESTRPPTDYSFGRGSTSTWYTSSMSSDDRDKPPITGWPPPQSSPSSQHHPVAGPLPVPAPALMLQQPSNQDEGTSEDEDVTRGGNFSRVLVGSVCAMCQRLTDEDGELGLFFFTHDLAVRTEGVFRLKFTLTNLSPLFGAEMSPSQSSSIAAQTYSDPFTVYSAKRFPGVIPTTKLTRVFAAQNVKLPTRQRRGVAEVADEGDDEDEEA